MKKAQLFVHRNYDTIKLILIFVIFVLTFIAVVGQIQKSAQDTIEREEHVARLLEADQAITQSIKAETEAQTEVINRQFRALCILIIDTSGQEGLNKLDPDSRERCERLAENPELTEETAVEQQERIEEEPAPQNRNESFGQPSSNNAPEQQDSQLDTSQQQSDEDQSFVDQVRQSIVNFMNSIRELL